MAEVFVLLSKASWEKPKLQPTIKCKFKALNFLKSGPWHFGLTHPLDSFNSLLFNYYASKPLFNGPPTSTPKTVE